MKTKFNNAELAHVWASQSQEKGDGSNMFFEGNTIYSYGYHYPLARIDGNLVFINANGYSNTTAKHESHVRRAVSHMKTIDVFSMPTRCYNGFDDNNSDHRANFNHWLKDVETLAKKSVRAVKRRDDYIVQINRLIDDANQYAEHFRIKSKFKYELNKLKAWSGAAVDKETLQETLKREAIRKRNQEIKAKKQLEKENQEKIQRWLDGENISLPYGIDTLLRLSKNGENVETSKHATVPLREANTLYKAWKKGKNIHGIQIGHYTVTAANKNAVHIGCHELKANVIDAFFEKVGVHSLGCKS